MAHIVIIGNGIAGITCARMIRKNSNDSITVISAETEYFFSRTALMYIYMGHMKYEHTKPYEDWFWKKNRIDLVFDEVISIDTDSKQLQLAKGQGMQYDKLVLATGSISRSMNIEGHQLKGVQTLYGYPDLQLMEENSKGISHAVIVGGGLIGIEMAEMLLSRNIKVTIFIREKEYWNNVLPHEESKMVSSHIREHHVTLLSETELGEITGDVNGRIKEVKTKNGEIFPCEFLGLTIGVFPNIGLAKAANIETDKGILVDEYFETSAKDVYAIGDCVELRNNIPGRRNIEPVWYAGRMQGETLAKILCGKRQPYQPGPWFNSAKFFDIEYQTYGSVPTELADDEETFYWQHPKKNVSFRVVYKKQSETVIGFNTMGLRIRHELCDQWLRTETPLEYVMSHLHQLNFEPEFTEAYHHQILETFNSMNGRNIPVKKKKAFLFF